MRRCRRFSVKAMPMVTSASNAIATRASCKYVLVAQSTAPIATTRIVITVAYTTVRLIAKLMSIT
jgi:hypothetical protein